MTIKVKAIVAMDEGRVIGSENQLPWRLPEDMKRFSALTKGHAVLMGRKTYESLPSKFRPLPERLNLVVSRTLKTPPDRAFLSFTSPEECFHKCREGEVAWGSDSLWVIGGAEIYRQTLAEWDELFLTMVHSKHPGDAFFPKFEDSFELVEEDRREGYSFQRWVKRRESLRK